MANKMLILALLATVFVTVYARNCAKGNNIEAGESVCKYEKNCEGVKIIKGKKCCCQCKSNNATSGYYTPCPGPTTTTTAGSTTTTAGSTTAGSTTAGSTTTTAGSTTTTAGSTTTTAGSTTTTAGSTTAGSTTAGSTTTTAGSTTAGSTTTAP